MNEPVTGPYEPEQSLTPKTDAGRTTAPESGAVEAPAAGLSGPQRGKFRILKEHARGGLGQVSVAVDSRLKRQVALKEIRPDLLGNPQLRQRFITEAEITGMLEHPGIVPIYAFEEDETGQPYYAMRFIQGRTLGEAIQQFHQSRDREGAEAAHPPRAHCRGSVSFNSLTFRELLQRFVSVCQTMAYAHSKGVIHRDLKPANIMLGDYGETLVLDWGLAKRVGELESESVDAPDPSAATLPPSHALTQEGQVLGTPAYMSPEQARGEDAASAVDTYALGAILYELLTGRVPYQGQSGAEVLAQLQAGSPPAPASVVRSVPKPLDAVCRKAMAREINNRYASAVELARDVDRWLADEPVSAYGEPWPIRARRWARKHPRIVTGSAATLLLGVVGLGTGLAAVEHERKQTALQRDEKDKALTAETRAREAEKQARDQAMTALRDMTDDIVENQMARGTHLTNENKEFLRKIIKHFESFSAITADDADSRAIRAEGNARVGRMRHRLGELKEAEAAYNEALSVFRQLGADFPTRPEFRHKLATTYNNVAILLATTGRLTEAEAAWGDALRVLKQLATDFPTHRDIRHHLAAGHHNLGNVFRATGRLMEAEIAYRDGVTVFERLAADFPTGPEFRQGLASSHHNLGVLLHDTGRLKEAEAAYGKAVAIQRQLVVDFPALDVRAELANSHNNLGNLLKDTGRLKEAETSFVDGLVIRKQLATDFPTRPEFRAALAGSHNNLAILLYDTNRLTEAETAFADALAIRKRLAADFPTRLDFRQTLAENRNNYASLLRDGGRLEEAEAAYTDALALFSQLAVEFPSQRDLLCNSLAGTFVNLAGLCIRRRDFQGAKAHLEEAQSHHQTALQSNPRHRLYRLFYRNNLYTLAKANAGLLDRAGSVRAAEKIRDLDWEPTVHAYDAARALAECIPIVQIHAQLDSKQRQAAVQFYGDQAMAMLRNAVAKGFKDVAHLKQDKDLDALRDREDFKKLVAELEDKRNQEPENRDQE